MNIAGKDGDDIYHIPRSSMEIDVPVLVPNNTHVEEDTPPVLRPKTRDIEGTRVTSSVLDRQNTNEVLHPKPRHSSLKNPDRDVPERNCGGASTENKPSSTSVQRAVSTSSDGTATRRQTDAAFITKLIEQSGNKISITASSEQQLVILEGNKNSHGMASKPAARTQGPVPANRPIPRPRTRVPPSAPQNLVSHSQNSGQSSFSSSSERKEQPSVIKSKQHEEDQIPSDPEVKEKPISISYNLPPDADTLELMLNDEVDKKYGLSSTQNEGCVAESKEISPKDGHIAHKSEENYKCIVSNSDSNEYVNPEEIKKNLQSQDDDRFPAPPTTHSTAEMPPYFQIKKNQLRNDSSDLPSVSPDKNSQLPESKTKINLGLDLLDETSTDNISVSDDSGRGFDKNSTLVPAVMEPFHNIQPFRPNLALFSDALNEEKQKTETLNQDFSDFDPLCANKSVKTTHNSFAKRLNYSSLNVQQNSTFAGSDGTNSFDTSVFMYATAENVDEPSEAYYSQIDQVSRSSDTQKMQTNKQSFHHAAPIAPPPPLPRQQNLFPVPKAPPVPPRPENAAGPSNSPVTSRSSPATTASSSQSLARANIFEEFPSSFSQLLSSDPFENSNFDPECLKFNRTRVPDPPTRSPLPNLTLAKPGGSSLVASNPEAPIDPKMNPERISQFVIPPPGSYVGQNTSDYDLARDLSSSDSESVDFPIEDGPIHGWPSGALPKDTPLKVFNGTLSPKRSTRDGYLYKQGGYKANKGWKKRWVVFNGSSLSYYNNNVSQISKRIIPVRCMVNIDTDVKDNDKSSFKFKVVTSLKDRVFIFSAETLEDCLTWAQILMAAITEYKRSLSSGSELPPDKPDKEGFIKFSNLNKYYVTVTGKIFSYYQSFEDFQMGSPVHEIDMKLASVKVKDHRRLQLWIHYGHIDLAFDSDQEMQQWRLALEDAIAEGLSDDTVLKKVYENMSNHRCADCNAEDPHWASINLGIVICKNCAGVHRMFDYKVSKIRSLRMDTRVWTPSLTEMMTAIGNANANAFWEFDLPKGTRIQPNETMERRIEFISRKYHNKKFCNLHALANTGPALGEALLSAATSDNVLDMMRILFSGVDVLYRKEERSLTAYDIAKEHGHRLIMELLYQNGGDPQSLEQDKMNEKRLREDIRLQGFLNKTGPLGKKFEKRWCVLEHGAMTYYLNEKSKTFKGSIDRNDMYMIQAVDTDRNYYSFELSTSLKDNRIFTFSSDSKDDWQEWMRIFAKLMAPVAVMDHVGMIDIKLAGYAFIKESLVDEWHETFVVFSWRGINYMNRDLKFDYIDLRKASGIKMQDSSNSYQNRGQCFVISSTGKSVYIQAALPRDTEKMYISFQDAITSSGQTLYDQALTNENVPVIVDRCITHIHMHGMEEKGIYRTAGQNSKVQTLLDEFRKNPWSCMSDYTVQDVANVLKRFLRELDDSVFERSNYLSWIRIAGCKEMNGRLKQYKSYLKKMPQVNYHTLKRIILHLVRVSKSESINMMSVTNLASCFAPSLLRVAKDEQPSLTSDASSKEISIIVDLMNNLDYFFSASENERAIMNKIQQAEDRMRENKKHSLADPAASGILTPIHLLSREGQSINVLVTEEKTAKEAMDYLKRNKAAPELSIYVLYEQLFKGALERPLFPEDIIAATTRRWMEWESWVLEDNSVCLCARGLDLLEKLSDSFNTNHVLLNKLHYCDSKPKSKFKKKMVGFRQCKLALYNDSQGVSESASWNVEDIVVYLGTVHKKPPPPTQYCLTFTVAGERYTKPPFGHCLSFDTEDELYRWVAALYTAQHPSGLLSWVSECCP